MSRLIFCCLSTAILLGCASKEKQAILLAERKAPLGWVYLEMYKDDSFKFISRGLFRDEHIYKGTFKLNKDTILFHYDDSIPKAGKTAILSTYGVSYIDGSYRESLKSTLNKLNKKD
jgi:hypothetical protein